MANKKSKAKAKNIPADREKTVKSSVSASKDNNMVSKNDVNLSQHFKNLNSQYIEKQDLVDSTGHRSTTSQVIVDGDFFVQLDPVVNNYEIDRVTANDNETFLQRSAAYSKTPKIKTRKSPNSKFDPLVDQYVDAVGIAKNKANARQLTRTPNTVNEALYPDTANFVVSLNVSGHIPFPSTSVLRKINSWQYDERQGFIAKDIYNRTNRILSTLHTTNNAENITGALSTHNDRMNKTNTANGRAVTFNIHHSSINWNQSSADAADIDSFLLDVDTNNFLVDYNKLKSNIKRSLPMSKLPSVIATDDYIYSKLVSDIDFVTLLYILFDSWNSNFSWQNVLSTKLGIMDETIKIVSALATNLKRNGWDKLKNIARIFEYIPVNKRVIDVWNTHKNASKLGRQDINAEGCTLLIPHFQIFGNIFQSTQSTNSSLPESQQNVDFYDLSSGIGNPIFRVPVNNMLDGFRSSIFEYHRSAQYYYDQAHCKFTGNGSDIGPHTSWAAEADRFSISAVRMTSISCNILMSIIHNNVLFNQINRIITQFGEFYATLKEHGAYSATGFEFMSPPVPTLFTKSEPTFADVSIHKQYLMDPNPRYQGREFAPLIQQDAFNIGNYYNVRHSFVYDSFGSNMFIQKLLKAFVVSSFSTQTESANSSGEFANTIHANLESIVLTTSIIIPFSDKHGHLFTMNTTPVCQSPRITFTKNINNDIYMPAVLFEFVKHSDNSNLRIQTNMTPNVRHISCASPDFNYYLTTDRLKSFMFRATHIGLLHFVNLIGIPGLNSNWYSLNTNEQFDFEDIWSYELPEVCTYRADWVSRSFGAKSLDPDAFADGEILSPDSITIVHQNDDKKDGSIE